MNATSHVAKLEKQEGGKLEDEKKTNKQARNVILPRHQVVGEASDL